jgi:hypothetical protein
MRNVSHEDGDAVEDFDRVNKIVKAATLQNL